ncbi:hypothetical protein BPAE_0288g00090 [Botrytis paeoniae]|uniref:2EXR domain-containing protein n=1 Tax=Botrytis paeoniae TaxID=278948 RepID=A0A4Z1FFX5_9HELO|nr:hypothetical protein BPAE_0288g00090 [Botrytis paeoniae]
MSTNKDLELSGTKPDSISKRKHIFLSAIDNVGLNSIQKLLAGMIGKGVTVITNRGDFGLFEWFPTEIKLKIWKYAFEAPRIVSVSFKDIKHSSSCRGHVRLFYSGQQNPQLYVNRLTRQQAIRRYNRLARFSACASGSKETPEIKYNAASDTIWLRGIDFWSVSTGKGWLMSLYRYQWTVQTLAITSSSRNTLMDMDDLHRLSVVLASFFSKLRESIVIMDYLDLTTPGLRDEITFINLLPESFPKHRVFTNYSPTIFSLSEEFMIGVIYGEGKPDHWYTSICSLTHSLKSYFMWKQETVQTISNPTKTISAEDFYRALRGRKTHQGDESRRQLVQVFRNGTVPSVKFLAATTYKQLEEIDRS